MKTLTSTGKCVFLIHLACLILFGAAGFFIAGANHVMLGVTLGSLVGTLIPGVFGSLVVRRRQSGASAVTSMCAGVFDNKWIKDESTRPAIETIRGYTYAIWMSELTFVLFAGFAFHAAVYGLLLAAGIGILVGWLISVAFDI